MELKEKFEQAIVNSKNLSEKPGNDSLLQLYSLYKQSTEGNIAADPPANPFDFVSKAKYEAWFSLKDMPKEEAMTKYIDLVNTLKSK